MGRVVDVDAYVPVMKVGEGGISVVQLLLYCVCSYFSGTFTELIKPYLVI